jgi:hypothetical protein
MSFLHVTIKNRTDDGWHCIFKDLSQAELKKKLVTPYRLGKDIFYDGNILQPGEISQIKINNTDSRHEEELKLVQEESYRKVQEFNATSSVTLVSIGSGYNDYEINQCGREVTANYISSGPGGGTTFTAIGDFIKHPWVVRIVGGLVFLALAFYIGLR